MSAIQELIARLEENTSLKTRVLPRGKFEATFSKPSHVTEVWFAPKNGVIPIENLDAFHRRTLGDLPGFFWKADVRETTASAPGFCCEDVVGHVRIERHIIITDKDFREIAGYDEMVESGKYPHNIYWRLYVRAFPYAAALECELPVFALRPVGLRPSGHRAH